MDRATRRNLARDHMLDFFSHPDVKWTADWRKADRSAICNEKAKLPQRRLDCEGARRAVITSFITNPRTRTQFEQAAILREYWRGKFPSRVQGRIMKELGRV